VHPTQRRRRFLTPSLAAALAVAAACGGGDKNPTQPTAAITLAVAPTTLTAAPGESPTAAVTLTRTNFTGAVNLAVEGMPDGVTASFDPASPSGSTNTSTLTLAVGAAAAEGTYNLTVRASGDGIDDKTAALALTVATAPVPGFSLAVAPTTVSAVQGGTGTATVTITRTNGFAGAVDISTSGAPTGVTLAADPASVPGNVNSSTLTVTVGADVATGSYPITVTGAATGLSNQGTTFTLQVTQSSGGGNSVAVTYCEGEVPIWVAAQDGTGAWTRVAQGANNTFTFNLATAKGGLAAVTQNGDDDFTLSVLYGTKEQFTAATAGGATVCTTAPTGTKTVNGSVTGVDAEDLVIVALGDQFKFVLPGTTTFTFTGVPDGNLDLIATRYSGQTFVANKIAIRRNVNAADNSTLDPIDFAGTEAFDPATANLTINGINNEPTSVGVLFLSASATATILGGTPIFFEGEASTTSPRPYYGVPADKLQAGDLHVLFATASPEVAGGGEPDRARSVFAYFTSITDRTVTLGPDLAEPTLSTVSNTPYLQPRAQFAVQAEYNQFATISFTQDTRDADVSMTAGYAGGAGFDLTVPDLSGVEGFDSNWGLLANAATNWDAGAFGGENLLFFLGGRPTDGTTLLLASRNGTLGGGARALRAPPSATSLAGRMTRVMLAPRSLQKARLR
jgi:hypothetical protein